MRISDWSSDVCSSDLRLFPRLADLRAKHPELHLDIDTAGHTVARLGEGLDVAIALAREIDPALDAGGREISVTKSAAGRRFIDLSPFTLDMVRHYADNHAVQIGRAHV